MEDLLEEDESQSSAAKTSILHEAPLQGHQDANQGTTSKCDLSTMEKPGDKNEADRSVLQTESADLSKIVPDSTQDSSLITPEGCSKGRGGGKAPGCPTEGGVVREGGGRAQGKASCAESNDYKVEGKQTGPAGSEDDKIDVAKRSSKKLDVGKENESGPGSESDIRERKREVTDGHSSTHVSDNDVNKNNENTSAVSAISDNKESMHVRCEETEQILRSEEDLVLSLPSDEEDSDSECEMQTSHEELSQEMKQRGENTEKDNEMEEEKASLTRSEIDHGHNALGGKKDTQDSGSGSRKARKAASETKVQEESMNIDKGKGCEGKEEIKEKVNSEKIKQIDKHNKKTHKEQRVANPGEVTTGAECGVEKGTKTNNSEIEEEEESTEVNEGTFEKNKEKDYVKRSVKKNNVDVVKKGSVGVRNNDMNKADSEGNKKEDKQDRDNLELKSSRNVKDSQNINNSDPDDKIENSQKQCNSDLRDNGSEETSQKTRKSGLEDRKNNEESEKLSQGDTEEDKNEESKTNTTSDFEGSENTNESYITCSSGMDDEDKVEGNIEGHKEDKKKGNIEANKGGNIEANNEGNIEANKDAQNSNKGEGTEQKCAVKTKNKGESTEQKCAVKTKNKGESTEQKCDGKTNNANSRNFVEELQDSTEATRDRAGVEKLGTKDSTQRYLNRGLGDEEEKAYDSDDSMLSEEGLGQSLRLMSDSEEETDAELDEKREENEKEPESEIRKEHEDMETGGSREEEEEQGDIKGSFQEESNERLPDIIKASVSGVCEDEQKSKEGESGKDVLEMNAAKDEQKSKAGKSGKDVLEMNAAKDEHRKSKKGESGKDVLEMNASKDKKRTLRSVNQDHGPSDDGESAVENVNKGIDQGSVGNRDEPDKHTHPGQPHVMEEETEETQIPTSKDRFKLQQKEVEKSVSEVIKPGDLQKQTSKESLMEQETDQSKGLNEAKDVRNQTKEHKAKADKVNEKAPKADKEVSEKVPKSQTKADKVSEKAPKSQTKPDKVSEKAPKSQTKADKVSEKAPKSQTKADKVSEKAPKSQTKADKVSEKAPKSQTKADKVSEKAPKSQPPIPEVSQHQPEHSESAAQEKENKSTKRKRMETKVDEGKVQRKTTRSQAEHLGNAEGIPLECDKTKDTMDKTKDTMDKTKDTMDKTNSEVTEGAGERSTETENAGKMIHKDTHDATQTCKDSRSNTHNRNTVSGKEKTLAGQKNIESGKETSAGQKNTESGKETSSGGQKNIESGKETSAGQKNIESGKKTSGGQRNIAKKSTSKLRPRPRRLSTVHTEPDHQDEIIPQPSTSREQDTEDSDEDSDVDSDDSDIVILAENIQTAPVLPRAASFLVCDLCQMLWNDSVLEAIFEGNKCVTVNSKITYGAIMCFSRYADVHYVQHKDQAVRNVLERADLGKNIGSMKMTEVVEWLTYLMLNGSATCCKVFDAMYNPMTTDFVFSSMVSQGPSATQELEQFRKDKRGKKNPKKNRSVSSSPCKAASKATASANTTQPSTASAKTTQPTTTRSSSSSNTTTTTRTSRSSSSSTSSSSSSNSSSTSRTTKNSTKDKNTSVNIKDIPAGLFQLQLDSSVVHRECKVTPKKPRAQTTVETPESPLRDDSLSLKKNVTQEKFVMKECTVYLGKPVQIPSSPHKVDSPSVSSSPVPRVTKRPLSEESDKGQQPRKKIKAYRQSSSSGESSSTKDSLDSGTTDTVDVPMKENSTAETSTSSASTSTGSSKESGKANMGNIVSDLNDNIEDTSQDKKTLMEQSSDTASTGASVHSDDTKRKMRSEQSTAKPKEDSGEKDSGKGEKHRKQKMKSQGKAMASQGNKNVKPSTRKEKPGETKTENAEDKTLTQKPEVPTDEAEGNKIMSQDHCEKVERHDNKTIKPSSPKKNTGEVNKEDADDRAEDTVDSDLSGKVQVRDKKNMKPFSKCKRYKGFDIKGLQDQIITKRRDVHMDVSDGSSSSKSSSQGKRSAVDSAGRSSKKQKVLDESTGDSSEDQKAQETKENLTGVGRGESSKLDGNARRKSSRLCSENLESSVSSFGDVASTYSDDVAPSLEYSDKSDDNTIEKRPERKAKEKVEKTARATKTRPQRAASTKKVVSYSGETSDSNDQQDMGTDDSLPQSRSCTDYSPVPHVENTEESDVLIKKLGLNVDSIELYCNVSDKKMLINRDMIKKQDKGSRPSHALRAMIKERSNLDGVAKEAFDLLPFEPNNVTGTTVNKERYLTNQELLVLQSICVLTPEAPDVDMFYQILIQLLLARRRVLLVPNSLALLLVAERVRKEFNRSKRKGNHYEYLAQDWDACKLYTTEDFWLADKKPPKVPTVRTVLSMFCLWKNLEKRVPISLPIALEELCRNLVLWDVDKIGICVKLYSRYCTFLYEEKNPGLAEFFLNQPFNGSKTLLQKNILLQCMAGESTVALATISSRHSSVNVTDNDVQLLLKLCLEAEQAVLISPGPKEEENFRKCIHALKHKVDSYKKEIHFIQKVTKETEKNKFQLLSKFSDPHFEELTRDLNKTTEVLYRLLGKRTTKFEMMKEAECLAAKDTNKVCRLSATVLKAADLGENISHSMKELVYELLLNDVKVDEVRPALCAIVESLTNKSLSVVPSDSWIRNFARITGLKVKSRNSSACS